MIKLENVSKYYNTNNNVSLGLQSINCELNCGDIVAIVGESGSGKSTFLNVITGMDTYEDGEIYFNSEETSYYSAEDLEKFRKNNVGFIFQNYNLVDSYTVLQNVMMPLILRGCTYVNAKKQALEILQQVGLEKRVHHKSTKLSGGEKQRCVIARALASDSKILACDEPTGNLDSKTGKEIIDLIKSVSQNRLVLIVTHNYDEVKDIVNRRLRFHDGSLVEDVRIKEPINVKNDAKIVFKEDYKLRQKDYFKLAINNILATPKKTFLSLIVFLVISIAVGTIYQNCYNQSVNSTSGVPSIYNNNSSDRLVVFDRLQKPIDVEKIKQIDGTGNIVYNSFYEDISVKSDIYFQDVIHEANINTYAIGYLDVKKYDIEGRLPQQDDEIIIGIKDTYLNYLKVNLLESVLDFNSSSFGMKKKFKIVGYFEYYNQQLPSDIYIYGTNSSNDFISNTIKDSIQSSYVVNIGDRQIKNCLPAIDTSLKVGQLKIIGSELLLKNIPKEKISVVQNSLVYSKTFSSQDIIIEYDDIVGVIVLFGNATPKQIFDECFQLSIYTSKTENLSNKIRKLGYEVHIPSKMVEMDSSALLSKVLLYFLIFISTFGVLAVYLFSYLVLSRIYASKNRDYTIIRTLGCNKKDMSNIVLYEVLIQCMSSAAVAALIILIGNKTTNLGFFKLFDSVTVLRCLAFLVVMSIFSLLVSRKFNRKLFKFSVNTTLKKEALSND